MKTIYPGERGILVQYMQLALTRAGYVTDISGLFDESTCLILNAFLRREMSCVVDDAVWEQLLPYLKGYLTHTVSAGDTFYMLARRYRTKESLIMAANPQVVPENIPIGSTLTIPLDFSLVSSRVPYTSWLNELVIEGLCARYPFLSSSCIGKSVIGRSIMQLRIGRGEKQIFYNGSFHANESITTPLLLKFAEDYGRAYATGGTIDGVDVQQLYRDYCLMMVPMVNPDGVDLVNGYLTEGYYYEQAETIAARYPQIPFPSGWKANIDGVDLNLQFPAGWELAKEIKFAQGYTTPAPRDYVGEAPLSAPESRTVYEFTLHNDFRLILAYHTQGEVIYWKYQDYEPERSKQIADYFSYVSGYAVEETPSASGNAGYKDWFILSYNRPGYTIEAGEGVNPLPMNMLDAIYEVNRGILLGGMLEI